MRPWALLASIIIHTILIGTIFFVGIFWKAPAFTPGEFNLFYISQLDNQHIPALQAASATQSIVTKEKSAVNFKKNSFQDAKPSEVNEGSSIHNHSGADLKNHGSQMGNREIKKVLLKIRNKIENAKHYPVLAKNKGLEGKSQIRFEINQDGSVKNLSLSRSSGYAILDDSALQAVKKAAPFPYYAGILQFDLKFQLSALP